MNNITIPYDEATVALAKEVCRDTKPYTPAQLAEIPAILACKARYFWGNDLNDWDILRYAFTEEAPEGFRVSMGAGEKTLSIDEQLGLVQWSIGPQEEMVPMHFGHNQIVQFLDDTHCRVLTRMNDRHTYKDNGEIYAGWGLYVDDMMKCKDGVWRISYVRLTYGVMYDQLRCVKKLYAQQTEENK